MTLTYRKSDRMVMAISVESPTGEWYTADPSLYEVVVLVNPMVHGPSLYTEEGEIQLIPNYSPV